MPALFFLKLRKNVHKTVFNLAGYGQLAPEMLMHATKTRSNATRSTPALEMNKQPFLQQ
jgi:hypothetical protein